MKIELVDDDKHAPYIAFDPGDAGRSWMVLVTNRAIAATLKFQVCESKRSPGKPTNTQICQAMYGDIELSAMDGTSIADWIGCSVEDGWEHHRELISRAEAFCRLGFGTMPDHIIPGADLAKFNGMDLGSDLLTGGLPKAPLPPPPPPPAAPVDPGSFLDL